VHRPLEEQQQGCRAHVAAPTAPAASRTPAATTERSSEGTAERLAAASAADAPMAEAVLVFMFMVGSWIHGDSFISSVCCHQY